MNVYLSPILGELREDFYSWFLFSKNKGYNYFIREENK